MSKKALLIGFGCLLVCGGAWIARWGWDASQRSVGTVDRPRARAMHERQPFGRDVSGVTAITDRRSPAAGPLPDDVAAPATVVSEVRPEVPTNPARSPSPEEHVAATEALLDASLATGSRDLWARDTEAAFHAQCRSFASEHPELAMELQRVECTAEVCRIVLASRQADGPMAALGPFTTALAWPGEQYAKVTPGDDPRLVLYAMRQGATLPRPAESELAQ
jgi:hypothetical protein